MNTPYIKVDMSHDGTEVFEYSIVVSNDKSYTIWDKNNLFDDIEEPYISIENKDDIDELGDYELIEYYLHELMDDALRDQIKNYTLLEDTPIERDENFEYNAILFDTNYHS